MDETFQFPLHLHMWLSSCSPTADQRVASQIYCALEVGSLPYTISALIEQQQQHQGRGDCEEKRIAGSTSASLVCRSLIQPLDTCRVAALIDNVLPPSNLD